MEEMETKNILIAGVGGQGILLSSEILAMACLGQGYDVKQSEVHGMAQRGGSVVSHVRYGSKVRSPLIPQGQADVLLGFEILESLRWLPFLRARGRAVVNTQRLMPSTVSIGLEEYPSDIEDQIRTRVQHLIFIPGQKIARELGNPRITNMVLLGALSSYIELPEDSWIEAIERRVPPGTVELNLRAFERGHALSRDSSE